MVQIQIKSKQIKPNTNNINTNIDNSFWVDNEKTSIVDMKPSSLARRCSNYLACEHHLL